MAASKIYLSKIRDFGENLGESFQFIRQEFKPFFRSFLLTSGVFMLASSIVGGIYQARFWSVFNGVLRPGDTRIFSALFNGTYLLVLFLSVLGVVAMKLSIASYMKLYDRTGISPTLAEVWAEFQRHIFPALVLTVFIIWPLIILGLLLCLAPGIYLAVVFAPAIMIMVNEDASIGQTFSRCFELVKENFWLSLCIYMVAYIIYFIAALIISLLIGAIVEILVGIGSYFSTEPIDSSMPGVVAIKSVLSYCVYTVFYVSVCLNYFNLAESLDGFGMMKRLENLGNINPNDKIEEQY